MKNFHLISLSGRTLLSSTHSTNDNKWVTIGWKFISKYRGSNKGMEGIAALLGIVSNVNRFSASAQKQGNIQLAIVSLKWESEVYKKLHFFPTLMRLNKIRKLNILIFWVFLQKIFVVVLSQTCPNQCNPRAARHYLRVDKDCDSIHIGIYVVNSRMFLW